MGQYAGFIVHAASDQTLSKVARELWLLGATQVYSYQDLQLIIGFIKSDADGHTSAKLSGLGADRFILLGPTEFVDSENECASDGTWIDATSPPTHRKWCWISFNDRDGVIPAFYDSLTQSWTNGDTFEWYRGCVAFYQEIPEPEQP